MAIDNLTFAMNVEEQRKKLIKNLKDKGVEIDDDVTLGNAIDNVNKINKENNSAERKDYLVKYYDIDGAVLKEEYVKNGEKPNPPHTPTYDSEILTFFEWADLPEVITEPTFALATYKTTTKETYLELYVYEKYFSGLTVTLQVVNISEDFLIDWGDNSSSRDLAHTYQSEGRYVIKISGSFNQDKQIIKTTNALTKLYYGENIEIHTSTSTKGQLITGYPKLKVLILPKTSYKLGLLYLRSLTRLKTIDVRKAISWGSNILSYCRQLVKIAGKIQMGYSCLEYSSSLESATFKSVGSTVTYFYPENLRYVKITGDISSDAQLSINSSFYLNVSEGVKRVTITNGSVLNKNLTLPSTLEHLSLPSVKSLTKLNLPEGLKTFSIAGACRLVSEINFPDSLEGAFMAFTNWSCLKKIKIPSKITSIGTNFLKEGTESVEEIIIMPNTVLTVSNTIVVSEECIIWVNDDVIEEYKTATNWSAYADKMRPLSEKPID